MERGALRVLIVEDDPEDAHLILRWLTRAVGTSFPSPEHVESQAEALDACRETPFDAVLLDLGLPDAVGLEGFRRFREAVPEVALVVLTGLSDESIGLAAIEAGAQDYLVKGHVTGPLLVRSLLFARERLRVKELTRQAARHEMLQQAAVALTHHVRNTLTPILGLAQGPATDDAAQAAELLELVVSQATRIAAILDALEELASTGAIPVTHNLAPHAMLDLEEAIDRYLTVRIARRAAAGS